MRYDVVVIGGGHAGTEASAAAARAGAHTLLITHRIETIGAMSCNPAIGGLGKGHIVREIDALDGVMARAIDYAGIHFKILNRSKGAAVRGPRAQADRSLYKDAVLAHLLNQPGLEIREGEVTRLDISNGKVSGVWIGDGTRIEAGAVVLTTGTFLRGVMHVGPQQTSGGRVGDAASTILADQIEGMGLNRGRLKTGTPARLDGRTIDWDRCEMQPGDAVPEPFSDLTESIVNRQIVCGITRTTAETHRIISDNIRLSAMFSGNISGRGPRYCPSIEDKVVRFADRESHQIFLEPEGLVDHTVYPNGLSTSLPEDIQEAFLRTIPGLADVKISRFGYAIEYDFVDPRELEPSLQVRKMPGLFLAGQINGTTGYEEAAGQGLVGGLNAARLAKRMPLCEFPRSNSYIGVMINDLTRLGVSEPYRMFTSRAEYRLTMRADNADRRLTQIGWDLGLVGPERYKKFLSKRSKLIAARTSCEAYSLTPEEAGLRGIDVSKDGIRRSVWSLLSRDSVVLKDFCDVIPSIAALDPKYQALVEIEAKYAVYLERQKREIDQLEADRSILIPPGFDFENVPGLSSELKSKFANLRPRSVGEVAQIEGSTPAAVLLLAAVLQKARAS